MTHYEIIAEGLSFPEGPVVMADGSVIVMEIMAGQVTRCWGDGRKEVVSKPGGGPNGAAIAADGSLWVRVPSGWTAMAWIVVLRSPFATADSTIQNDKSVGPMSLLDSPANLAPTMANVVAEVLSMPIQGAY